MSDFLFDCHVNLLFNFFFLRGIAFYKNSSSYSVDNRKCNLTLLLLKDFK